MINLPKNTKIGKKNSNTIMVGGQIKGCDSAQIFIECICCSDTIAILPTAFNDRNKIVDSISDSKAIKIFRQHGWTVFGDKKLESTKCPSCQ